MRASLVYSCTVTGQGENPAEADVKKQLDRVKAAMLRCKEIKDRAKRPRPDQAAAGRLVSSGLWEPGQAKLRPGQGQSQEQPRPGQQPPGSSQHSPASAEPQPPRKKIKQFDV